MNDQKIFRVAVFVEADDEEKENEIARALASDYLREGIDRVILVAGDDHVVYEGGEVRPLDSVFETVFAVNPNAPPDGVIMGADPKSKH